MLLCCHAAQPISPTAAPALTAPLPLLRRLRSGTSQSVPFVAGVMALIQHAAPAGRLGGRQQAGGGGRQRLQFTGAGAPCVAAGDCFTNGCCQDCCFSKCAGSAAPSQEVGSSLQSHLHLRPVCLPSLPPCPQSGSPNLILQNSLRAPISLSPDTMPSVDSAASGPFAFSLALTQRPTGDVRVKLSTGGWQRVEGGRLLCVCVSFHGEGGSRGSWSSRQWQAHHPQAANRLLAAAFCYPLLACCRCHARVRAAQEPHLHLCQLGQASAGHFDR